MLFAAVLSWAALFAPLPFVSAWWLKTTPETTGFLKVRNRFADWLVMTGQLKGKSREEVLAVLGPPPAADKFRDWDLVYVLGPERGLFQIDYEWLVMRLDSSGRVSDAEVVRD
jgi:hypothetical protein